MSVEAISWALNLAPVPADRGGQPSSACKFVLVGLANHAGPDGSGAFSSARTLIRYTGLSERTVRACLGRLEAAGLIRQCDPNIVAVRIKRADRRPRGCDLDLTRVRTDLDDEEVAALECQFPGLATRLAAAGHSDDNGEPPAADGPASEVQSQHPVRPVDNPASGVQPSQPAPATGCNERAHGVQSAPSRGAVVAPEPYTEPPTEPSAACARTQGPSRRARRGWRRARTRVLRRARRRRAADRRAAGQAHTGRYRGAEHWLVIATTYGVGRGEHDRRAEPVRGTGRPAVARRAARAGRVPAGQATVVRPVRRATRLPGFDGDTPRPCPRCRPAACAGRRIGPQILAAGAPPGRGSARLA